MNPQSMGISEPVRAEKERANPTDSLRTHFLATSHNALSLSFYLSLSEKFVDVSLLSSKYHTVDNDAKYLAAFAPTAAP